MSLDLMADLHSQESLSEYTCKCQNEGTNFGDKSQGMSTT